MFNKIKWNASIIEIHISQFENLILHSKAECIIRKQ